MSTNETEPFYPGYGTCTSVTDRCPVEATLYGGYFTTAVCAIFTFVYALLLLTQAYFAGRGTLWSYTIWLGIGTVFQLVGYAARTVMSFNPWIFEAFIAQNLSLVVGPTFTAAAISITFKFLVMWYGAEFSMIRPKLMPYVFVGTDFFSIIVQSAGGGMASASSSGDNQAMGDLGSALLTAGVIFQVVNMAICGGLMVVFIYRRRNSNKQGLNKVNSDTNRRWTQGVLTPKMERAPYCHGQDEHSVRIFSWALGVAYVAILVRCIYRVPEMTMGWGSELMQNETTFLILDGSMMMISTAILSFIHPATYFPYMTQDPAEAKKVYMSDAESHEMRPMN